MMANRNDSTKAFHMDTQGKNEISVPLADILRGFLTKRSIVVEVAMNPRQLLVTPPKNQFLVYHYFLVCIDDPCLFGSPLR